MSQAMLSMRLVRVRSGTRSGKLVRHRRSLAIVPNVSRIPNTQCPTQTLSSIHLSFSYAKNQSQLSSAAIIRATDNSSDSTSLSSISTPTSLIGSNSTSFGALEVGDQPFRFSFASELTSSHPIALFGSSPPYAHDWFHGTTTGICTQEKHVVDGYGRVCNFRGVDLSEICKTCVC